MITVRCEIVRWIDDEPQPGWVEARLNDAHGKSWLFEDKPTTFSAAIVTRTSTFPLDGELRCEVIATEGAVARVRLIDLDEDEYGPVDVRVNELMEYP